MRNVILAIGALTLFTASYASADPASHTIGGSQEAASLATGGAMGMETYTDGDNVRSFALAADAGVSTEAPVRMLPAFAEDGMKTIGNDD